MECLLVDIWAETSKPRAYGYQNTVTWVLRNTDRVKCNLIRWNGVGDGDDGWAIEETLVAWCDSGNGSF